jgi:hypothetical protein
MTTENEENGSNISKPLRIEMVNDDEAEHFHNEETDKTAHEAEIISETRFPKVEREEQINDKLSEFLAALPNQADTKFIVARLPDNNLSGNFRLPCDQEEQCEPVYWNGSNEPSPIYSQITKKNGGGIYRIRTHNKGGFVKDGTWVVTLSDPAEPSAKEKLIKEQREKEREEIRVVEAPPYVPIPQPFIVQPEKVDEMDLVISVLEKSKKLHELTSPPPAPAAPPAEPQNTARPMDAKTAFIIELYRESQEKEQKNKLLNAVLNIEDKTDAPPVPWYENFANTAIEKFAESPALQGQFGALLSGVTQLVTAVVVSKLSPPAAAPPATGEQPAPQPPPIDLDALKQPRNDAPAAPPPETQPQAPMPPPAPHPSKIPFIKLGAKK